jgi:hypothetical protein
MKSLSLVQFTLLLAACAAAPLARAQAIPASLTGRWRIARILPTKNTPCWDADRAKTLLDTTLVYEAHAMVFQDQPVTITEALTRTLSRRKFQDEYKFPLDELGIKAEAVTELDLQHEDADITGATTEVPGDTILLAGPGKIIVSACGVFYAAVRLTGKPAGAR